MREHVRRILDIGGGYDSGTGRKDGPMPDVSRSHMRSNLTERPLRGALLAINHPNTLVIIIDPQIPKEVEDHYLGIPNLHFVEDGVHTDKPLPFEDAYFDEVEINFGFRPMSFDQLPLYASTDEWLASLTDLSDIPVYRRALMESGRVLQPGGRLVISERKPHMEVISRILSSEASLEFLSNCGLQTGSLTEVTEISDDLSPQAAKSLLGKQALEESGSSRADAYRVFSLEFTKVS